MTLWFIDGFERVDEGPTPRQKHRRRRLHALRLRRYRNMSCEELDTLGKKLHSRTYWLTEERYEVCQAWAHKMAAFFNATPEPPPSWGEVWGAGKIVLLTAGKTATINHET